MTRRYYLAGTVAIAVLLAASSASVTIAQTPSPAPAVTAAVTFHKDVEPILQKNCQSCHRPGQIAPMSLLSYQAARPWARAMKTKVVAREMPPWFADPQHGKTYITDRSLTQADIDTIATWVDAGAPEGDPKDAPPAVVWPKDGWSIQPDVVVRGPSFKVPARPPSNVIEWTTIIVPTGFTKDTWVTSVEIKPSDLQVTHHICIAFQPHSEDVLYYTPFWNDKPRDEEGIEIKANPATASTGAPRINPVQQRQRSANGVGGAPPPGNAGVGGGFLCYLPGNQSFDYRPFGAGALIPAGYDISIAQHYTPSGRESVDLPQIGFTISNTPPKKRWVTAQAGNAGNGFAIPPNEPNYLAPPGELEFGANAELVMMMPHMHVRGRDMTYTVVHPDGRKEVALSVPKYDFNWQMQYVLSNPVKVAPGAKLHVEAHYNNSTTNKFNPNPNRWVYPGNMTWEEMMSPFFGVLVDTETDPTTVFRRGAVIAGGGE
jgi:hypothetical protein